MSWFCKEQSSEVCQLKNRIRELDIQLAGMDGRELLPAGGGRGSVAEVEIPAKFDLVPHMGRREVERASGTGRSALARENHHDECGSWLWYWSGVGSHQDTRAV
jgi:hypothetical protein